LTLLSLSLHFNGLDVASGSDSSALERSSAKLWNPLRSATIDGNQPALSLIILGFVSSIASIISLFPFEAAVSKDF